MTGAEYQKLFSLRGKTIVVTGGAGHLGTPICRGLAAFGARVWALGRDPAKLAALTREQPSDGGSIEGLACDVTDDAQLHNALETIHQQTSSIDVLINNAAARQRVSLECLDRPAWLTGLDGALHHYFTCSMAASRYMIPANRGVIINNASIWSILAPNKEMYLDLNNEPPLYVTAAKGAILQMTKHLAAFWARHHIRVNAISPGFFPQRRGPDRPDYMHQLTSRIPMRRIGAPDELVGIAVYLASDASSYVTGQNIVVDGGYSLW